MTAVSVARECNMVGDNDKVIVVEAEASKTPDDQPDVRYQVWSLSSFEVSRQLMTSDLNQVSSFSLLMTASMALANEGLLVPFVDTGRLVVCNSQKLPRKQVVVR